MFGDRLKNVRGKLSLTQKALAQALGVSQGHISALEQNEKIPGGDILISLKKCFGVDLNWMLTGEGQTDISNGQLIPSDPPELAELLDGARKVLTSGNPIAFDALERNIRYFSHAIEVEKRMQGMEADLAEMKSYVMEMKRQEEAREKSRLEEQSSKRKVA